MHASREFKIPQHQALPDSKKSADTSEDKIKLSADIAQHTAWAFKHIYSKPYPGNMVDEKNDRIARLFHGIQHVTRAAIYIPVLANLYRRYGDKEALALTSKQLKLIQIAALFHDSAREGEEEDLWDDKSGLRLYAYLTEVLSVPAKKAVPYVEAAINKDFNKNTKKYISLILNAGNANVKTVDKKPERNIFQKLIHDADCLDIIRARDCFDAAYLDFYRDIAQFDAQAFDEMAQLITEVRSIIETQGDGRRRMNEAIKKNYEHTDAYPEILKTIYQDHFYILPALYAQNKLLSTSQLHQPLLETTRYDKTKPLDEANLSAALREGKVFARSIVVPSAIGKKDIHGEESLAAIEFRKMNRRLGVPTRTLKSNRTEKHGNPKRSVSLIGWGGRVYTSAGFLIVDPDMSQVSAVSEVDFDSGHFKKKDQEYKMDESQARQQLTELVKKLKMGGVFRNHGSFVSAHTEILYRITEAHAIYTTEDETLDNLVAKRPPHSRALQAIFLQNEMQRITGKKLPIFEYSGLHNSVKQLPDFEPREIVKMWVVMCSACIQASLPNVHELIADYRLTMFTENIKTVSMYGSLFDLRAKRAASADSNYPPALKMMINIAIEQENSKLTNQYIQHLQAQVRDNKLSIFAPQFFYFLQVKLGLCEIFRDKIYAEIKTKIRSENFFKPIMKIETYSDAMFVAKIYHLMTKMQLKEAMFIKAIAVSVVAKEFEFLFQGEKYYQLCTHEGIGRSVMIYEYGSIKDLLEYIHMFQFEALFQDEIKNLIFYLHQAVASHLLSHQHSCAFHSYKTLIEYIENLGLCNELHLKQVMHVTHVLGKSYVKGTIIDGQFDFEIYLYFANKCKIPKQEKKRVFLLWASHTQSDPDHYKILFAHLKEAGLLSDFEVVVRLILNLKLYYEGFVDSCIKVSDYLAHIDLLQTFLPEKKLNFYHDNAIKLKFEKVIFKFTEDLSKKELQEKLEILMSEIVVLRAKGFSRAYPAAFREIVNLFRDTIKLVPKKDLGSFDLSDIKGIEKELNIRIFSPEKTPSLFQNNGLFKKRKVEEEKAPAPKKLKVHSKKKN